MTEMDQVDNEEQASASNPVSTSKVRRSWWSRLALWLTLIVVISIGIHFATDVPGATVFGAVVMGSIILRVGYFVLQQFATPPPPPPDPGLLRKVRLTYRCSICGTEVRMTAANNEDPEPPRHCMEDMDLVAPTME